MTQLDDGHDYLHAKNKDKIFKQKQMRESGEAYVVVKSKPINEDLDTHPMYKAEDATVVFKNKHGELHKIEVPRLIRVFNNNIWQNSKSVK
jgi:hypothetical protein